MPEEKKTREWQKGKRERGQEEDWEEGLLEGLLEEGLRTQGPLPLHQASSQMRTRLSLPTLSSLAQDPRSLRGINSLYSLLRTTVYSMYLMYGYTLVYVAAAR